MNQRRTKADFQTRPYPAGFEKSGRVAKGRAGLPKLYCAVFCPPISPYPPSFSIPGGYLRTRRVDSEPGRLVRLPVAPVKSWANGDLMCLMKPQLEFDLQTELPNRQIKPHRRITICLRLNRSAGEAGSRPARRVPSRPGG